jgi:hypothetical protein
VCKGREIAIVEVVGGLIKAMRVLVEAERISMEALRFL